MEDARTLLARLVEVQPDDVIFTSGATESNALAIHGVVGALKKAGRKDIHILYLPSSHASIVENVKMLQDEGVTIEALPIKEYRVDTDALADMLRSDTALVTMDAVCGETGVIWNTREVAETLKKSRNQKTITSPSGTGDAVRALQTVLPAAGPHSPPPAGNWPRSTSPA
ncbi:MAG: hypothetical protein B7Z74_06425 [Deltaproteobacteria bacterium 21-66-5]|nr:MAG: hypothetical protein B7Z74_06425 [Deltaproteobacteria bacterium 21-66-5]